MLLICHVLMFISVGVWAPMGLTDSGSYNTLPTISGMPVGA